MSSLPLISVYIPLKLPKQLYTYKIKKGVNVEPGNFVLVPFGNRKLVGIVCAFINDSNLDNNQIKEIIEVLTLPSLQHRYLKFLEAFSKYNLVNFGLVLKMALTNIEDISKKRETILTLNYSILNNIKLSPKVVQVIDFLKDAKVSNKKKLMEICGVSSQIINTLIKKNVLVSSQELHSINDFQRNISYTSLKLTECQRLITEGLLEYFSQKKFKTAVLQGVPGSGKTEVYFEIVNSVIKQGQQVLILLPEIGLSTQLLLRFKERFGVEPYLWHSDVSKAQKKETWLAASSGKLKVIVGARSALFLPFKNLGLIIVDEEHDSSYKQEESVIYSARDMAVLRAQLENISVILVSATPSVETYNNIMNNKYKLFNLNDRYNNTILPSIDVVDLTKDTIKQGEIFSKELLTNIEQTLDNKEQVLLFLNKRGYVNNLYCYTCEDSLSCKQCSFKLVYHKSKNLLVCHHCGYNVKFSGKCFKCENELKQLGIGVEKIQELLYNHFPNVRCLVISSDTINSYKKAIQMVEDINNYKYDILIGTQLISKGYHFPKLTLVAILNTDLNNTVDLKSNEKTWQMLYQVAGRAGRESNNGKVILQTFDTKSYLVQSLQKQNYELFINKELQERKKENYPPFGKLVAIILSCVDEGLLDDLCCYMKNNKPDENVILVGPYEPPLALLRGKYRRRFLLHSFRGPNIREVTQKWLNRFKIPSNIKLQIDVDPVNFY